jgi:hypothetical protein
MDLDTYPLQLADWQHRQRVFQAAQLNARTQLNALATKTARQRKSMAAGREKVRLQQQVADLQEKLRTVETGAAESAAARPTAPVDELRALAEALRVCGEVLTRETYTICFGSRSCSNLANVSESYALVRGQACVCGGCLERGADPAVAKR